MAGKDGALDVEIGEAFFSSCVWLQRGQHNNNYIVFGDFSLGDFKSSCFCSTTDLSYVESTDLSTLYICLPLKNPRIYIQHRSVAHVPQRVAVAVVLTAVPMKSIAGT